MSKLIYRYEDENCGCAVYESVSGFVVYERNEEKGWSAAPDGVKRLIRHLIVEIQRLQENEALTGDGESGENNADKMLCPHCDNNVVEMKKAAGPWGNH